MATRQHRSLSVLVALDSFTLHLRAAGKADSTVVTYRKAVEQLDAFLGAEGRARSVTDVTRRDVEAFLAHLRDRGFRPATIANRFRSIQQFARWLADEGEIQTSFTMGLKPPAIPEEPPPVLTPSDLSALLRSTEGTDLPERRDRAILSLLMDTGMRVSELVGLRLDDLSVREGYAVVLGKGRRPRTVVFDRKAAADVDRYLRKRPEHSAAETTDAVWLGERGPLTVNGVEQMIRRRARQAGLEGRVYPHLFRHTFAHQYLSAGGQEGDLMRLAGWKSRQLLDRYGASAAAERARASHKALSPRNQI